MLGNLVARPVSGVLRSAIVEGKRKEEERERERERENRLSVPSRLAISPQLFLS